MSIITINPEETKHNYYHIFFCFHLRNYDTPIAYHFMSHSSTDALYSDTNLIQSAFETLQETCCNKINFSIQSYLSEHTDNDKIKEENQSLKDFVIIDVIEDIVDILTKELENNEYDELPNPAIARKCNHIVLGIYANKDIKYNIVANSDIIRNYIYNTICRFGRLIYTDGIRTHNGCIKTEYLEPYDKKAKTFYEGYGKQLNLSQPTIPYE